MNILVISNLYPPLGIGGYEERCLHTVNALRERGHTVNVLTSNHKLTDSSPKNENGVYRELQIHGFYGHPWLPIHKLYKLEKKNQKILKRHLRELSPDVVHVWNMGGISKSLLLTLESTDIPLVYDISDHWIARSLIADVWLSWWNEPGSIFRKVLRGIAKTIGLKSLISKQVPTNSVSDLRFDNIYFCSAFMRNLTVDKGYPVAHADVIYCGVESELFKKKKTYPPVERFIWVGRLAEDKDPLTTIRGVIKARNELGKSLTLDIYGRGSKEYVDLLKGEIDSYNASDYIHLKSATHTEMRALYADYDAYIFSSNWGEPFALTPLEAMSAQVPVIMCPDGGDAELLEDGLNALEFQAGNPESLSNAIKRLVQLKGHGQSIAEYAYNDVMNKYTVDIMTAKIESYLQSAIVDDA